MRFRLLSVIWGKKFIDSFLRTTLRSLKAPGNLSDVASQYAVGYTIHTTLADAKRIQSSAVYQQLSKLVEFDFQIFKLNEIDPENSNSHWSLWKRGIDKACDADECVITVAPDHLFSRGTLSRWCVFFEQGYLAVFTPGIQVVQETIEIELGAKFANDSDIDVDESYFKTLMFGHLHPINITMFRDSPRSMNHPEYHLRAIPGVGFTQNILASHAVAFRPAAIRMDENFCPTEKFDRIVFDSCRFLSAEPLLKLLPTYYHPWRMDDVTLSHFGSWADTFMTPANWLESEISHVYSFDNKVTEQERLTANTGAQFYVKQIRASWATYRLWRFLKEAGLYQAARWLSAGHILYRLRRRIAIPAYSTLFILCDQALDRLTNESASNLLHEDGRNLIAEFREYISVGHHQLTAGDWLKESLNSHPDGSITTLSGRSYKRGKTGAQILRGPLQIDGLQIYVIDKPLGATQLAPNQVGVSLLCHLRSGLNPMLRAMTSAQSLMIKRLRNKPFLFQLTRRIRDALISHSYRRGIACDANQVSASSKLLFNKALTIRALSSIRELYDFYQLHVLGRYAIRVAPSQWVSEAIGAEEENSVTLLETAVLNDPKFCEAWLELGYAYYECERFADSLSAFKFAQELEPTFSCGPNDLSPQNSAAIAIHDLLLKKDELSHDLERQKPRFNRGMNRKSNLLNAKLLIYRGEERAALAKIEKCMSLDYITSSFAKLLPNQLSQLLNHP